VDGGGIELEAEHLAGDNDGARRADETTQSALLDLQRKEGRTKRHRAYLCQHWRPTRLGRMHAGRDRARRQAACPCARMQADRQARQLADFF
jgi:hypothetical protein